jgi:DMSO reductase family type II enzyme iron-sulfur subunit
MVLDLNKCIGCQTCTVACKTQWTNRSGRDYMYWNHVETVPGRGYPRDWQRAGGGFDDRGAVRPGRVPDLAREYGVPFEVNYEQALNADGLHAPPAFTAPPPLGPTRAPAHGPNWDEDQGAGEYPNAHYFYLPRICNHCSTPACLAACPRRAIYKRDEDGIVLVDQSRCRGYQHCIEACPYKKVYFNPRLGRSEKCLFCYPRVEEGLAPACARQCVGRIRFVGFLDDERGPVWKLVRKWQVALPLHAEFGTGPNVYYVPPLAPPSLDAEGRPTGRRRIPQALLVELFGPRVPEVLELLEAERERKRRGEPSELMDTLIAYRHAEMFVLDATSSRPPGPGAGPPSSGTAGA